MKSYDSHGRLVSEINKIFTSDGKRITTVTMYNTYNGSVIAQDVTVRDSQGNVNTTHAMNGKLLP